MTNYISRAEADELCDELIRQFMGDTDHELCVDIDCFVTHYLRCPVVYENFAEDDPDKIGFASDGVQPLRVRTNGRTLEQVYPQRTIVLDRVLLNPGEEYRRRFTIAHEAGHIIASRMDPNVHAGFHRVHDECRLYTAEELRQKYCGDSLLQKTITVDCISKTRRANMGEAPMYYVQNSHPAIISRETFQMAQVEIARRKALQPSVEKKASTAVGKPRRWK